MNADNFKFSLLKNIKLETSLEGISLVIAKTGLKEGVRIFGSLLGGAVFDNNPMTASVLRCMFERGTKRKKKEEIYSIFDKAGASFSFFSNQFYLSFSLACLKEDCEKLLLLISEMIREPAFAEKEFINVKKQIIAELRQEKTDTQRQGHFALKRALYPKENPNYIYSTENRIDFVKKLKLKDIKNLQIQIGRGGLSIVAIGDCDSKKIISAVKKGFGRLKLSKFKISETSLVKNTKNKPVKIFIPDKQNVDLLMGCTVPIAEKDHTYMPLMVAAMILGGGGFTGRLMREVRVKRGLTYGIRSSVVSADYRISGYFFIWGTFAPALVNNGKKAINEVVKKFYEKGVTEAEVDLKKKMILGNMVVNVETSAGLGKILLSILEEGRIPESAWEEDVTRILKITAKEVNESIKCYLNPKKFTLVEVGTFLKDIGVIK
ncbi:MAG: pitrilysin family protein [bacterium]|nr:pitrilysin family protein [bacterium]